MALDDIMFLGDIHGRNDVLASAMTTAARGGIDTIVQVGDFWCYDRHRVRVLSEHRDRLRGFYGVEVTVHFIDGNHEDYRIINPHGLPQVFGGGVLVYHPRGDISEINGVILGFFGGAVSINREQKKEHSSWFADEFPSPGDIERARQSFATGVDVLVTHEIPERAVRQVITEGINPQLYGSHLVRDIVDEVLEFSCARLSVHGHWHKHAVGTYGDVSVLSLGHDDHHGVAALIDGEHRVAFL